jgi:hypothetical protein
MLMDKSDPEKRSLSGVSNSTHENLAIFVGTRIGLKSILSESPKSPQTFWGQSNCARSNLRPSLAAITVIPVSSVSFLANSQGLARHMVIPK